MGSLKLLSAYDTSSDSDGEHEELSDDMKFQHQTDKVTENKRELLPLPSSVSRMFSEKHSHVDSPELHQGRKRTFPHQRGNWATFVFAKIPITLEDKLRTHVLQSLNFLKTDWTICDDFHISLSRTVSLPHHCIDPFFSELKIGLKDFKSISLRILSSIQVYTNDENTRTFLSFPIHSDYNEILIALSKRIDTVFTRFRLQEYYKNPSFHISFAWICNENVKSLELINNDVGQLNHYFSNLEYDDFFQITEIICKAEYPMFILSKTFNSVLLVGEGNFSFSFALLKQNVCLHPKNFYATCYESLQQCIVKYGETETSKNIQFIQDMGATVLDCIDATKLADLGLRKFELIIFQFPHTGRKASIKNNRDLLRNFFISAQSLLNGTNGFVVVTLCAGQGGTPADSVKREYCNTWKIVEMAAYANLILTKVQPFGSDAFSGYLPTGKRNAGNEFHTARAMSHVFRFAEDPPTLSPGWISISNGDSNVDLSSNLKARLVIMDRIPDTIPPYQFAMQIVQNLQQKQNISEIVLPGSDHKELCVSLQNAKSNVIGLQLPSLLKEITQDSFASAVCHALSFPLMKMSDIDSISSIQYDMLVATNNCDELLANFQAIFESYSNYQIELNIKPSAIPFKCLSDTSSLEILEQNSLCVNISSGKQAIIGQHCLLKLDHCNRNSTCLSIILLEIDKVMLSLNPSISSNAMWSLDEKTRKLLWHAFSQRDVYVPQSLFPPKYVHDISFWVRSGGKDHPKHPLTMDRLKSIIVQTADQSLSSVELLDEYNDGNCSSMCIRVTYQSCDFCLSRQNCSKLNDIVRKNISQVFNVILR